MTIQQENAKLLRAGYPPLADCEPLHTPGPWRSVCASAHEFNPNTTRRDIIGKCEFGDAYVAGDISFEDARLIAAAPDMFDALRAIVDAFGDQDSLLIDQAKVALAKAEGRAE